MYIYICMTLILCTKWMKIVEKKKYCDDFKYIT